MRTVFSVPDLEKGISKYIYRAAAEKLNNNNNLQNNHNNNQYIIHSRVNNEKKCFSDLISMKRIFFSLQTLRKQGRNFDIIPRVDD